MERIDEVWRAAVADSGLDPSRLHRFEAVRSTQPGAGAQWWAPGESVGQPPLELAEADAAAADDLPLIEKHRVATVPIEGLASGVAEAALAAKLRHELEHARQWEVCGREPFGLMQLALKVHSHKMGGTIHGAFRNQMPIEDDANAAAAVFIRKIRPDAVDDLRNAEVYSTLARAVFGPASPETLVVRMVGFLFQYRDVVRDLAVGLPEASYIRLWAPGAVRSVLAWQALCDVADAGDGDDQSSG